MLLLAVYVVILTFIGLLSYALAKIYVRTGHRRIWPTLAFLPFALSLAAFASAFMAGFNPVSILFLIFAGSIWFSMIVGLAIKHWPSDATLSPEVFE